MDTRTTRLPVDLLDAATAEGLGEHRSTSKQVEHWARFGMFLSQRSFATRRRIQRAAAGEVPLSKLDDDERVMANALIDASISALAVEVSFADRLAARGVTTVVMDDAGRMVRRHPDGSNDYL